MDIEHTLTDTVLIITPAGESLDAKDAPIFKEKVSELISSNEKQSVVFDLHHLQFIDSSGLSSFLSIMRLLNSRGGEVKLVSMHKIFEIYHTTEEAVNSFKISSSGKTKNR